MKVKSFVYSFISVFLLMVQFKVYAHSHSHSHSHTLDHLDTSEATSYLDITPQVFNEVLLIENAWVKGTIPGLQITSGYMTLTNLNDETIRLVGVETEVAEHSELHRMIMTDNNMAMRPVEYIEIEAGQSFELSPSAYHLMFVGLKERLEVGESIEVDLIFDDGQRVSIEMLIGDAV